MFNFYTTKKKLNEKILDMHKRMINKPFMFYVRTDSRQIILSKDTFKQMLIGCNTYAT